jgi:hypothetical protein
MRTGIGAGSDYAAFLNTPCALLVDAGNGERLPPASPMRQRTALPDS